MEPDSNPTVVRPPRPPDEIIAEREECVRGDYVALMADSRIIAKWRRVWGLSGRTVSRYLAVVKVRWKREHVAAMEAEHERIEAGMLAQLVKLDEVANLCRTELNRKNEIAARTAHLRGSLIYAEKRGLVAPKKVEVTRKTDPTAAMSPAERRERSKRHATKVLELADRKTEGSA